MFVLTIVLAQARGWTREFVLVHMITLVLVPVVLDLSRGDPTTSGLTRRGLARSSLLT